MVRDNNAKFTKLRLFTDSNAVLKQLKSRSYTILGPLLEGKWAIEELFEHVNFLKDHGIQIHLQWVRGHGECEGNRMADRAVARGIKDLRTTLPPRNRKMDVVVPRHIVERGEDTVAEFHFRAFSKHHSLYHGNLSLTNDF